MKKILFHVEYAFNIFENRFTKKTSFETLHEIKSQNLLTNIIHRKFFSIEIKFMNSKKQIRLNVIDVVHLAQIKMIVL